MFFVEFIFPTMRYPRKYIVTNDTSTYKNKKLRIHSISSEIESSSCYIVYVRNRNYISGLSDRRVFLVKEKIL